MLDSTTWPLLIGEDVGLGDADCAAAGRLAPGLARVVDPKRDHLDAVAMAADMLRNRRCRRAAAW